MRGGLGIFLGCLILTVLVVLTAAGLTLVVSETNNAVPMSNNTTSGDYSPQADERDAGNSFTMMIVIGLWATALLLVLVDMALIVLMFL